MKRKVLCIALALLMCTMVIMPTFADTSAETPPERADITASFGFKKISGTVYRMWAKLNNPTLVSVYARLTLYDSSYNTLTSVYTTSSDILISLRRDVIPSSGTYHVRITFTADGATHSFEKTYVI